MNELPSTIHDRALAYQRRLRSNSEFSFSSTFGPFDVSARTLSGIQPVIWASTVFFSELIDIPLDNSVEPSIEMKKSNGRFILSVNGSQNFAFYVEVNVQFSSPDMKLRWDSLMTDAGPVNGVATLDSSTGLHYFATPVHSRAEYGVISLDSQLPEGPADGRLIIKTISILGFN